MKHRKLRIAWSVAFGVLAVLLCALWVRSYWQKDTFIVVLRSDDLNAIESSQGQITWYYGNSILDVPHTSQWDLTAEKVRPDELDWLRGFMFSRDKNSFIFSIPQWCVVLLATTLAIAPRFNYRFRLRTLIIATTLVAVVAYGIHRDLKRQGNLSDRQYASRFIAATHLQKMGLVVEFRNKTGSRKRHTQEWIDFMDDLIESQERTFKNQNK